MEIYLKQKSITAQFFGKYFIENGPLVEPGQTAENEKATGVF